MADKKITELNALTEPADEDILAIVDDPAGSPETKKITVENLRKKVRAFPFVAVVALNDPSADYNCDGTDDEVQFQEAEDDVKANGGGIVFVKDGDYEAGTITHNNTVSLIGSSRRTKITLKAGAGTLIIGEDYATAYGSGDAWAGIAHGEIANFTLFGNYGEQTSSGESDEGLMHAMIKIYAWDYVLRDIRIDGAIECGIITVHDYDWNSDGPYNVWESGENYYENIKMKNYGVVGWLNRGSHDATMNNIYISSSDDSGLTPYYGLIVQTDSGVGKYYGAHGLIANNVHIWGQHQENAVYIDRANVLEGFIYAEGCDNAAIKIVNSDANRFRAFVGYCTVGVELFGSSDYNNIEAVVESNVSGALFQIDTTGSNNILKHGGGYGAPGGAVFDLSTGGTYSGTRNTFIPWAGYTGQLFAGVPATSDVVEGGGMYTMQSLPIDDRASGLVTVLTAGESLSIMDVGYIKSDGKVGKSDADAADTRKVAVLALAAYSNNNPGRFLLKGMVRDDSGNNFTPGQRIYLSSTAGGITQTPIAGAPCIGVAISADVWFFDPALGYQDDLTSIFMRASRGFYAYNDFINNVNSSNFLSTAQNSGSVGLLANDGTKSIGVSTLGTGGSSASGGAGQWSSQTNFVNFDTTMEWTFETRVQIPTLSDGSQRFQLFAGFIDNSFAASTDGAYFSYRDDLNSGKFELITVSNSTGTPRVDSGITVNAGQWYKLKVKVLNVGGVLTARFYIDDVQVGGDITANIPTGTSRICGYGVINLKSIGTTNRNIYCDYQEVSGIPTTLR